MIYLSPNTTLQMIYLSPNMTLLIQIIDLSPNMTLLIQIIDLSPNMTLLIQIIYLSPNMTLLIQIIYLSPNMTLLIQIIYLSPNMTLHIILVAADNNKGLTLMGVSLLFFKVSDTTSISSKIFSSNVFLPTPKSLSAWRVNRRRVFHLLPLLYVIPTCIKRNNFDMVEKTDLPHLIQAC
jgi:hypothetical protein